MTKVKIGIVGLGVGAAHARLVLKGAVPRGVLAAVADPDAVRRAMFPGVPAFADARELFHAGVVDAVVIATPHRLHVGQATEALAAGLHVLVEKPVAIDAREARRLIEAPRAPDRVFAAMLNQRTDLFFGKIREIVRSGALGRIHRIHWMVTDWYRTDAYYSSAEWRATWAGEGGGVLLNQGLHQLDLLSWMFGPPARVWARCGFGRFHDIEVEDDVTAFLEFPDGAEGVFTTSTGDAPGTNRLEIAAERGRLVYEANRLVLYRNEVSSADFARASDLPFDRPACHEETFAGLSHGGQHAEILANFVDAILDGVPLIAPIEQGLGSVELMNALLLSAWTEGFVAVPPDPETYAAHLAGKVAGSRYRDRRGVSAPA